jgi:Ca-activated chloride channel family protein
MRPTNPACILAIAMILLASAASAADDPATPGALRVADPGGTIVELPLRHTKVTAEITAFVARTVVEQTFVNPYDHPVEAVYTFPLGDRAAVDDFELVVGDRTIKGEIKRREEARRIYESARQAGYQAALLEQERPNIFTQTIANLEPGREIRVRLRTVETLRYDAGVYRFTFPLVVGPRYIPGGGTPPGATATGRALPAGRVRDADRITPPVLKPGYRSGHDVEIAVSLDAGVPIVNLASPSHRILAKSPSRSIARVSLAPDDAIPNKDFMLRWNVSSERPAVGFLAHREGGDGFFTLLVQPKGEVTALEAAPKEILFVLDTSGSMHGIPLEASKRLAREALKTLGPRDTFDLIRFANGSSMLSDKPLPNDSASVERGLAWLDSLEGGGGTEMLAGFKAAFDRPPDPDRLRVVIFLTDGYIGNEHEILTAIAGVVGQARIYTFGIGSAVNHYLLDRMAALGRGGYVFVRPDENPDDAVERFRSWVTKPYLTDLTIDWGTLPVADPVPASLPDLGSGQTLTLVGRYLAPGSGEAVVRGKLGGRYWEHRLQISLPEREKAHATLASVWARHRIEELLMGLPEGEPPPSIEAEVTALALEYRLMSPFTSFVAVDDSRVVNPGGRSETIDQALPMPEGASFAGVFGSGGPVAICAKAGTAEGGRAPTAAVAEDHYERLALEDERAGRSGGKKDSARGFIGGIVGGVVGGVMGASSAPPPVPRNTAYAQKVLAPAAALSAQSASLEAAEVVTGSGAVAGKAGASSGRGWGTRDDASYASPSHSAPLPARVATLRGTEAGDRLLLAAIRVLSDLAEDGRLSPAQGRPALAALLGAQLPSGALAEDSVVQAFAAWALAEAAQALPRDPWVREAADRAAADLVSQGESKSVAPAAGPGADAADSARWVRLVLGWLRPAKALRLTVPPGAPSAPYLELTRAIAGTPAPAARGVDPWSRLLRSVQLGNLKFVR